jgi:hypothetical protein
MPSLFIQSLIKPGLFNLCWVALLVANYFGLWLVKDGTNATPVLLHVHTWLMLLNNIICFNWNMENYSGKQYNHNTI